MSILYRNLKLKIRKDYESVETLFLHYNRLRKMFEYVFHYIQIINIYYNCKICHCAFTGILNIFLFILNWKIKLKHFLFVIFLIFFRNSKRN